MKMNLKGVALATVVAMSSFAPAKAAGIADALQLTNYFNIGQNLFVSSLTTDDSFLDKLEEVAQTSTFSQIVSAFVNFANSKGASLTNAGFSGAYSVGANGGWSSTILFSESTGTIQFAGNTVTATTGNNTPVVPVPGPEAGAGLGALAMAGMAYVAMRRRKQQLAA
ncbi:MAG: hypothetical protein KKH33_25510 [Alphaproteobacteria bacterium]|nr:hypothetical protein [Alphaproteobacteria bacterium]